MYSSCIFCSASLGANESIEEFPVGRGLAFDGARGRLWAVCGKCGRWNLAPIEERWEATETAERLFRDSRLRVHSENIGLAKLADGTRLIRVGEALRGELAAWRYGDQLVRRRRQYLWATAGVVGVTAVAAGGLFAAGAIGAVGAFTNWGSMLWQNHQSKQLVYHLGADESPTGAELWLRRHHLHGARVQRDRGEVALVLPEARVPEPSQHTDPEAWKLVLRGAQAEAVLGRAMVMANTRGARKADVSRAIALLTGVGSPDEYLARVAERDASLGIGRMWHRGSRGHRRPVGPVVQMRAAWSAFAGSFRGEKVPYRKVSAVEAQMNLGGGLGHPLRNRLTKEDKRNQLKAPEALALEMALHEETERRALQGELKLLESAWREAEEIAAIADQLPNDPLERLRG